MLILAAAATGNTTTSVSTVRTIILWKPSRTASAACKIILMSASSWLQGVRQLVCRGGIQTTSELLVVTICLSVAEICLMCSTRKANYSILFLSSRKNCCQFVGTFVDSLTLLLIPFPHLFPVWDLRLFLKYWSHTISTRLLMDRVKKCLNSSANAGELEKRLKCGWLQQNAGDLTGLPCSHLTTVSVRPIPS